MSRAFDIILAVVILSLGIVAGGNIYTYLHPNYWIVKITYCDNRDYKIVSCEQYNKPSTADIQTHDGSFGGMPVPMWKGHLNVCEIEVIEQVKLNQ